MPTILHDGTQLAYEERGAGDPTLVFVHGLTCNRSFFTPQVSHFAQHHRVLSVDLRGHGESDKPQGDYCIASYADDIAYLIERLCLGKVVAIGHSMGGIAVLKLADAHPDCVVAIVMLDPAPFIWPVEFRDGLEAVASALEAGNQQPQREFLRNLFLPTSDPKFVEEVLSVMLSAPLHVAVSSIRGMLAFDGLAVAARCKVPALHVAAAVPLNPPHLMSQWLPGVINGWTVGAGHFMQLEAPDQVNAMIQSFIRCYVLSRAAVGLS